MVVPAHTPEYSASDPDILLAVPASQSPSTAVRAAAVRYIAAAAGRLSPAEVYAQLLPLVRPQLREEPLSLEVGRSLWSCPCWSPGPASMHYTHVLLARYY